MSDKTEEPTPRRLAKAREKGDVASSSVLSQALGFVVALALVPGAVVAARAETTAMLRAALRADGTTWSPAALSRIVVTLTVPLLAAVALTSAVATLVQTGSVFAPSRVMPDLSRLDPIAGLRALLSPARFWRVGRALMTAAAVGYLGVHLLVEHAREIARTLSNPAAAAAIAGHVALEVARDAAYIGLFLAIVDVVITRRAWRAKLRMTRTEVRREYRESEGDPQLKAARRRAYQEMLAASVINAVRNATVVIVNPEHLATALRYDENTDEAPRVVASGDGELAARIQEAARAYGVPVVRDVPVARALRELEVGDVIPQALYEAIAEILREAWEEQARENAAAAK